MNMHKSLVAVLGLILISSTASAATCRAGSAAQAGSNTGYERARAAADVSIPTDKIALHDATLQAFLDGIPPRDPSVKRLKFTGNVPDTTIWQHGDDLLVRSRAMLRDEFEQTLSSADGTHLWKLPVTPLLTFSVNGQSVHVTPELE